MTDHSCGRTRTSAEVPWAALAMMLRAGGQVVPPPGGNNEPKGTVSFEAGGGGGGGGTERLWCFFVGNEEHQERGSH